MKNMPPVMKSQMPMTGARPAAGRRVPQESLLPISGDLHDRLASAAQHDAPEPFQRVFQKSLHDRGRTRDQEDPSAGDRPADNQDASPARAKRTEGETAAVVPAGARPRDGRGSPLASEAPGTKQEENSSGEPPGAETTALISVGCPLLAHAYRDATPGTSPEARAAEGGEHSPGGPLGDESVAHTGASHPLVVHAQRNRTPEQSPVGRGSLSGSEGRAKEAPATVASPQRRSEGGLDLRAALGAGKAIPRAAAPEMRAAEAAPAGAGTAAAELPSIRGGRKDRPAQAGTALPGETRAKMVGGDSSGGPEGRIRISLPESARSAASPRPSRGSTAQEGPLSAEMTPPADRGGRRAAPAERASSPATEPGPQGTHPGVAPFGSRGENPAPGERPDPDQTMATLRVRQIRIGAEAGLTTNKTKSSGAAAPVGTADDGARGIANGADLRFALRAEASGPEGDAGMADGPSPAPVGTDAPGGGRRPLADEKASPLTKASEAQTTDGVPGGGVSAAGENAGAGGPHAPSSAKEGALPVQRRQPGTEVFSAVAGARPGGQGAAVEPAGNSAAEAVREIGIAPSGRGGESRPESGGKGAHSGSPFGTVPAGRVHPHMTADAAPLPGAFAAAVADAAAVTTAGGEAVEEAPLLRQVVEASQPLLQQGGGRIVISLTPPSLGSLDIDVRVKRDTVELFVVANNQDVQQTLCSHIDQLRKALVDQGLNMERFQVVVGDRSDSQQGRDPRQDGAPGWQGEARGERGYRREPQDGRASDDTPALRRPGSYQSALGGINVFI